MGTRVAIVVVERFKFGFRIHSFIYNSNLPVPHEMALKNMYSENLVPVML